MNNAIRTLRGVVLLAVLFLFPALAGAAGLEPQNMGLELRTYTFVTPEYHASANAGTTAGTAGVLMSGSLNGDTQPTQTSSIAVAPYGSRLCIKAIDGSSNSGAITCTSAAIRGTDVLGVSRSETITSISESCSYTTYAYTMLDYADVTGCDCTSGALASGDYVVIRTGKHLWPDRRVTSASHILSGCEMDGDWVCKKGSAFTVDGVSGTVDLLTGFGDEPSEANALRFIIRNPRYIR